MMIRRGCEFGAQVTIMVIKLPVDETETLGYEVAVENRIFSVVGYEQVNGGRVEREG